jgi:hypothetical protein
MESARDTVVRHLALPAQHCLRQQVAGGFGADRFVGPEALDAAEPVGAPPKYLSMTDTAPAGPQLRVARRSTPTAPAS